MRDTVAGPAGKLQLLVERPEKKPEALAVICHPHPLHGGSLNNKIVHQLARTFVSMGALTVRFNFRGVGDSEGVYDEGRGELQDLLAVVAAFREDTVDLPLWLAGFSFGGFIAAQAASGLKPDRLVTVAPAVNYFPESDIALSVTDWLLIQGDADDIVPAASVQDWVGSLSTPPRLAMVEGAGHFFHGRLNELRQIIELHYPAG